jgi:hypothetical protein
VNGSEKAGQNQTGTDVTKTKSEYQDRLSNFILLQKFEDFCVYFFPIVDRFPRKEKWAFCAAIKNECLLITREIILAQGLRSCYHQHQKCEVVDGELKVLRFYIRHSHARKYLGHDSFKTSAKLLDEIGRILGRLLKPAGNPAR